MEVQTPPSDHLSPPSRVVPWPAVDDQSYNRGKEGRALLAFTTLHDFFHQERASTRNGRVEANRRLGEPLC